MGFSLDSSNPNPHDAEPDRTGFAGIFRRPGIVAGIFLAAGLVLSLVLGGLILNDLRHRTTMESAKSYASMLTVVRDYYSKVIIGSAKKSGVTISTQYHGIEGAIPPPATMTIEMGVWMQDLIQPGGFRWYSKYPFLSRGDGGPRTDFEREALTELTARSANSVTRVESVGEEGVKVLRLAEPIIMGKACVACHNSHPDSARKDWKIGDIRGVQIVSVAMPPLLPSPAQLFDQDRGLFISVLLLIAGLIGVSAVILTLMNRLRRAFDIADKRNQQLAIAQRAAQSAADAKTRIMSNVSRELRKPMNTIVGFTQSVVAESHGPLNNERYKAQAGAANDSAQSLASIMENMILMSELDAGETDLRDQAVDSGREVQRIQGLLGAEAEVTGVIIAPPASGGWPLLATDLRAFRQILTNLAGNAVRHAGKGATLRISAETDENEVVFTVQDDGAGIALKDLRRILQLSPAGDITPQSDAGSIGIGIAVSRLLAGQLGGSLRITTDRGAGLIARFSLPASRLVGLSPQQGIPSETAATG